MRPNTPFSEVQKLTDFNSFVWNMVFRNEQYGLLTLSKIEGGLPSMPEQFLPPTYAFEFVVQGNISGLVNNKQVELHPHDAFFIYADHVHKPVSISSDIVLYVIGFDVPFATSVNLQTSQAQLAQMMMRPVRHLTAHQIEVVLHYFEFLRLLIEENNAQAVLSAVRSFFYCLAEYFVMDPQLTHSLSRSEQICGQFLSLVELHCREQHRVEWYAGQMCLAPKYLSNVLKQTMDTPPNRCIDHALLRHAKSLLSSTSLSVQQISDQLGFQNQSHFGTFFRRQTNCSPKDFRLQLSGK